ncbi:MAG: hypothetical protein AAB410_04620 [Patescibacteria group bacterium]
MIYDLRFKKIRFALVVIGISIPLLAFARPADPSKMPKIEPLLPPPADLKFEFENAFNSPKEENLQNETTIFEGSEAEEGLASEQVENNVVSADAGKEKIIAGKWPIVVIICTFGLILGYVFWRKKFAKK